MKALTVRQPWAWAIIHGGKDVENRTTAWKYRGPLAIHAGGVVSNRGQHSELVRAAWDAADLPTRFGRSDDLGLWHDVPSQSTLQFGAIIGVVELVDVHEAHDGCCESPWGEREYVEAGGKVRRQLVHLELANAVAIDPIGCTGRLGLWDVPADVAELLAIEAMPA